MYERILVATDGSTLSKKAMRSGIHLAAVTGAELVAFNVVRPYAGSFMEDGLTVSRQDIARIQKGRKDRGQAVVDQVCDASKAEGVKATGIIGRSDEVAEAIIAAAKKHKCDLIVMASHGRKGIKRLLLGSETQHVLTHSSVPVLVLR
jgi:nucleotide-binding universal stress UspA family protein